MRPSAAAEPPRSPGRVAEPESLVPASFAAVTPAQGALAQLREDLMEWILRTNGRLERVWAHP